MLSPRIMQKRSDEIEQKLHEEKPPKLAEILAKDFGSLKIGDKER